MRQCRIMTRCSIVLIQLMMMTTTALVVPFTKITTVPNRNCRHTSSSSTSSLQQVLVRPHPLVRYSPVTTTSLRNGNNQDMNGASSSTNSSGSAKDDMIVARRIIVQGDIGGYYRSCVVNEAGKFRRLVGTMSPTSSDSNEAEIYVEGKAYLVEGFIRWCQRSKVGLNQIITVKNVYEEEPTGMYDDFYVPASSSNNDNNNN